MTLQDDLVSLYVPAIVEDTGIRKDQALTIAAHSTVRIFEDPHLVTADARARALDHAIHAACHAIKVITPGLTTEERAAWFQKRREDIAAWEAKPLSERSDQDRFYMDGPWIIDRQHNRLKP